MCIRDRAWYDPLYFSQAQKATQAESGTGRSHGDAGSCPLPGTAKRAESQTVDDAGDTPAGRTRENAGMEIEQLEQIAAVIVTAGLVADNFLMFTPWRNGNELRQSHLAFSNPQKGSVHPLKF